MKRYHQERERTKRNYQQHLSVLGRLVTIAGGFEPGRFRKRKPIGCGRPRCRLCHYDKIYGIPTVQDRIRQQRYADSLREFLDDLV
ncbi:MAG: hypothetical protein K1Y36_00675 [Blastocatellia bacterium]|nr:hypothetical protein [Blastocatellia bacterium]